MYKKLSNENGITFLLHGLIGSDGNSYVYEGGSYLISKGEII